VSAGLPIVARVLIGLEYNIGPKLLAEAKKHTLTLQQAMVCRAVPCRAVLCRAVPRHWAVQVAAAGVGSAASVTHGCAGAAADACDK
jgi:hypothetical protein